MVLEIHPDSLVEKNTNIPTKHLFLPSEKFWWEIRSRNNVRIYFIDEKGEFCSCMGYYFNYKRNEGCYHLEKIKMHVELGKYRTIVYRDEDYSEFAKKIVNETINELRRSSNI